MENQFQEVTSQSWMSRIGNSLKGILVGLVLFVVSFPLLFWNEGRAVKRFKTLQEGAGIVQTISAESVASDKEGQLIHTTALAKTDQTLQDPDFGVSQVALKLKRYVEMYQWDESTDTEEKKKLGGGTDTITTYSYSKQWSDDLIDSSHFHKQAGHENPATMEFSSSVRTATDVSFGAYTLPSSLVSRINPYQPLKVDVQAVPEELRERLLVTNAGLYLGQDPSKPVIGDLRISFEYVPDTTVSVVARQIGSTFEPYTTTVGGTIELLQVGTHSSENMFASAHASNRALTWGLRFVGFIIMFFGLTLILKPLSVLADVVPIFGNIVGAGTGFVAGVVAAVLSLVTIAIAWFVYRPLLSIGLLVAAGGLIFWLRSRRTSAQVAAPATPSA